MCSCSRQWCVGRKGCESVDVLLLKAVVCWKEECERVCNGKGKHEVLTVVGVKGM